MITEYKLKYLSKEAAITDFKNRGYIVETDLGDVEGDDIHAIVEVGKIKDKVNSTEENLVHLEGYHYDVYGYVDNLEFDVLPIEPTNPWHKPSGWNNTVIDEIEV